MNKTIRIAAIATLMATPNFAFCQPAAGEPPIQVKYLMDLAGQWEGPATMKVDGKELKFTYYADFKKTSANSGLQMHEWGTIPGMGKLDGSNLIGFDPFDGKIHWFSVDNLGTTHDHVGEFKDKDHFSMVHKSTRDGKVYMEVIELSKSGKDKLSFHLSATTDGKEDESITATFNRKGKKV